MSSESTFNYEEFYIPTSLDKNKIVGFDRDEIFLFFILFGLSMLLSMPILLVLSFVATYQYKKYKADKFQFLANLCYTKMYPVMNIKYMPRPFIKNIYGG